MYNKYVVKVGDEYVASYSSWCLATTQDIKEAALYGYDTAVWVAEGVDGEAVAYKD